MDNSLALIKKIPLIVEASKIEFFGETAKILKSKLSAEWFKIAKLNSEKVGIYRIVYRSNNHKVVGFILEPKGVKKLPCIIYNRGGSGEFGVIELDRLFGTMAKFAQWGYVVIASQYSGNGGSEGKDEMGGGDIHDVLNLYEILKKYPHADASRVGMYGHSRGGMMTYLSLARVKWIKAAVSGAAPADEVRAPKFRKGWADHQKKRFGGSLAEKKKRSALYWPEKFNKKTPILLLHGSSDWRVDPLNTIKLAQALHLQHVPFRLVFFEGADHSLSEFRKEANEQTRQWFERYLKNDEKINLKPHGE